jgi:hypothetical protein
MSFEQWLRDWALVIGGFGALLAAIAALATIFVTKRIQKKERRDTFRREILKWATRINAFALANRTEAVIHFRSETQLDDFINRHKNEELFKTIEPERSWSVYMEEVAPKLSTDLKASVDSLRECLRTQIGFLHKLRRGEVEGAKEGFFKKIAENNSKIHDAAVKVIRQVGKGDTSDL